jgi:hypothetical protein
MNYFNKTPNKISLKINFVCLRYFAIALIVLSVLMQLVYFFNTGNFNSPIIEFEFATSDLEIINLFTTNDLLMIKKINGVNDQNKLDFLYMFAYAGFLIIVFIILIREKGIKIYYVGILLVINAFLFDILENNALFIITKALKKNIEFQNIINHLVIYTRIKWYSLALIFIILALMYFNNKLWGKIFAVISFLPLLLALFCLIIPSPNTFTFFSFSVMLAFIVLIIPIFVSKFANISFELKNFNNTKRSEFYHD